MTATAHNGGRSQINFNFLQFGGSHAFINLVKNGQTWLKADNTGYTSPSNFNSNGYPLVGCPDVTTRFFTPGLADRPGDWVLRWTGNVAAGSLTGLGSFSGTDGEETFTPSSADVNLRINSGSTVTDIVVMHEDDVASYDAGGIFSGPFLELMQSANWGVLRFLDWQWANITNMRYWADRKPENYVFYHGDELRASMYGGTTSGGTTNYTVSAPPGWAGLVDKAIVIVNWNATATTNTPTLDVGGTGAKVLKYAWSDTLDASSRPNVGTGGNFSTCVYDQLLDCWLMFGGYPGSGGIFLRNGVPFEVMMALCLEVGAHPWFCTPYLSCDPITDFQTGVGTFVEAQQPSWMVPRYEVVPNETWNFGPAFYATRYAWNSAAARWGTSFDEDNWAGMVGSTGGEQISDVYGGDRTRYQAIMGLWKSQGVPTNRIASTEWVADGGEPAYDWITHVSPSCYVRDTYSSAERTAAVAAWVAGDAGERAVIEAAFIESTYLNDGTDNYQSGLAWLVDTLVPSDVTVVQTFNPNIKVTFYEGGWSPDYTGDANTDEFYNATRMNPLTQQVIYDLYMGLIRQLDVEFPSHYYLAGEGVWALFDPDIYADPSPQIEGIEAFNTKKKLFRMVPV